jgi:hypothetical protein
MSLAGMGNFLPEVTYISGGEKKKTARGSVKKSE